MSSEGWVSVDNNIGSGDVSGSIDTLQLQRQQVAQVRAYWGSGL